MTFSNAISTCFKQYAQFSGRAPRSEYWYFILFSMLVFLACALVDNTGTLSGLAGLAFIVPQFAAASRRLHDTDHSGWWQLLSLVPVVGPIVLIVWLATKSDVGTNRYGSSPIESFAIAP